MGPLGTLKASAASLGRFADRATVTLEGVDQVVSSDAVAGIGSDLIDLLTGPIEDLRAATNQMLGGFHATTRQVNAAARAHQEAAEAAAFVFKLMAAVILGTIIGEALAVALRSVRE